ncbi:MAG: hypothetical protein Q4A62_10165 [Eikenella sp.]|nr:hypothetical protein [Eikenella sp.]
MYRNVDEALKAAYRLAEVRIEPLNNTAQICQWMQERGVRLGGSGLSQHEWHANGAMIRSRVERLLNEAELAAVEAQYGGNLSRIVDLSIYILNHHRGIPMLACDDLLAHLFTGRPKQSEIQDRFDWSKGRLYRQKKRVSQTVATLLESAICKLEPEFLAAGIVLQVA